MKNYILEVCVDSVASALAAFRGGANRLELCSNLMLGGTTPGISLFKEIRKHTNIPIHVLIRPRFGDFCYDEYEFNIIREDIRAFSAIGAEGVVLGILKPDGTINMGQMKVLMEAAKGMSVTLHRAFDVCRDPYQALEAAKELGINTILTSGQRSTCIEGKELLNELIALSKGEIEILAGSGVDAKVIKEIYPLTQVRAYHMSGKKIIDSQMTYRKAGVSMGIPGLNEYELWQTDEEAVRAARQVLEALFTNELPQ